MSKKSTESASTNFFGQIRIYAGQDCTAQLTFVYVLSWLDYCNSVLTGLSISTVVVLQRGHDAAARLVLDWETNNYIRTTLRRLCWLPAEFCIIY
jgi:hypothetical protein